MNCNELDKRTKAYKECIKLKEANTTGVGDLVEKAIKATGLDALADNDCGCEERKTKLNKLRLPNFKRYPFVRCMTKQQYETWITWRDDKRLKSGWWAVSVADQNEVIKPIFERLTANTFKACGSCGDMIQHICNRIEDAIKAELVEE